MTRRSLTLVALLALVASQEVLACGDKFLVGGRGTRYQRPKNARAASVLIFASPAPLDAALKKGSVESVLRREGHRSTTAATLEQLSALLAGGRFDVVLAASEAAVAVEKLLAGTPDSPELVAFCPKDLADDKNCAVKTPAKEHSLLEAVDKAVVRHDEIARRGQVRG